VRITINWKYFGQCLSLWFTRHFKIVLFDFLFMIFFKVLKVYCFISANGVGCVWSLKQYKLICYLGVIGIGIFCCFIIMQVPILRWNINAWTETIKTVPNARRLKARTYLLRICYGIGRGSNFTGHIPTSLIKSVPLVLCWS